MRLLRFSNRFTSYSSYAIQLNLGRMILDISPHNPSESDFPVPPGGGVGTGLLEFSNRFTAYRIYPIEMKVGMVIPSYRSAQWYEQDFLGAGEGLRILKFLRTFFACSLFSPSQKSSSLRSER